MQHPLNIFHVYCISTSRRVPLLFMFNIHGIQIHVKYRIDKRFGKITLFGTFYHLFHISQLTSKVVYYTVYLRWGHPSLSGCVHSPPPILDTQTRPSRAGWRAASLEQWPESTLTHRSQSQCFSWHRGSVTHRQ